MLRTKRTIAVLLRHLLLGSVSTGVILASSAMLAGCEDESQPETWVKRLDDPAKRAGAIKRLTQFYEDGLTKNNNNKEAPEMKALLAKIVKPMAGAYVKGDLDEKTRVELLKALANTRDPDAKEAILEAIKNFAAGKAKAEEMVQCALYVKALKLKEAAGPLLDAFVKIKPSEKDTGPAYKETRDAMLAIPDPSWAAKMTELLNRPIDPKNVQEGRNEVYWQTVSAEVLGELKHGPAVKSLFKVLLQPEKKDVAGSAVVALIKIGKPAVVPVLDILSGKDKEMIDLAAKGGADNKLAYINYSAIVLGSIGRADARDPMIAALGATDSETAKAVIGREMSKLPTSPEAIKALQTAFEKVSLSTLIPPGEHAKNVIAEAAGAFMDASIVPWLLKQVTALKTAKGEKEEIDNLQAALLQTAMKLMKKDQVDEVKKLVDVEGGPVEKTEFAKSAELVNACGDNVGCYLGKLEDPASQERNGQMIGIKAAYMLGMLGNEGTKMEIVNRLPKVKNSAVRFVSVMAIDHLSPNGDQKIADELQKIVDGNVQKGDQNAIQGDAPIKQIIPRLRARAS